MTSHVSNESFSIYSEYLGGSLSTEDNKKLFIAWHENGDESARDKLILGNLKLLLTIVNKYRTVDAAFDHDDLLQIGLLGLIRAVDTYDYRLNFAFSTYAYRFITNELNLLWRKWKYQKHILSLNSLIEGNDGSTIEFGDLIPDDNDFTENIFYQVQIMLIDEMLDGVSDLEKTVLCKQFGLRGQKQVTRRIIGNEMGYSASYISRISMRAISKIRDKWLDQL